jgi:hypothetical protein
MVSLLVVIELVAMLASRNGKGLTVRAAGEVGHALVVARVEWNANGVGIDAAVLWN